MAEVSEPGSLKRSPLHARLEQAGAKFAEFGGWAMPLEFAGAGVLVEHRAVRTAAGIFDVSHLGKASVTGHGAAAFVNRCLTADLAKISTGQAQYTLICSDDGGVVDDLIAYRKSDDEIFLVPNAANCASVVDRLAEAAPAGVTVTNQHEDFVVLAVQGPRADAVVGGAGLPTGHDYMSFTVVEREGASVTVCRTGYTGERGYEIVAPVAVGESIWDALLAGGAPVGLQPAGLGARDTLRTEMGYPLHGQDISATISPLQARLGWAVGWKKDTFFGDQALRAERAAGPRRLLRGLRAAGRGIPRPGMVVQDASGQPVGVITSGTFSPTLRTGIALALVDSGCDQEVVGVDIRGRAEQFVVTKPPFVPAGVRA